MTADDMELVREYARNHSEAAFATLVERHVNLVYSVALRRVADTHLAKEITQAVFIILARKANGLAAKTVLPGWLCRTAHYVSSNALTLRRRRRQYEYEASMQSTLNEPESLPWNQIAPLLEDALGRLNKKDYDAVVLRFFENRSFGEVGTALGIREDTARMRISRALEKLRKYYSKRGVASTTAVIAGAISANSVQAAPITLAPSVSAIAIAKGATASASTLTLIKGTMKTMLWLKIKFAAMVCAGLVAALAISTVMLAQTKSPGAGANQTANDSLLITPGVSVGKVKSGMTENDVIAAMGQPDRKQGEVLIYDQDFGFSVVCSRQKKVGAIFCGGGVAFNGHTKEGIGIGSSQDDLVKALGQPTSSDASQGQIVYQKLGLTFTMQDGKVFHIIVDLRKPK
ncbi:MAG TPA: sigma-70 family RNA polymerase sigma factor [Pseudomonadales bacterium]|nr:sigma-70 family RNA polymerase sigma factor [Pseudomonadales bacterium]